MAFGAAMAQASQPRQNDEGMAPDAKKRDISKRHLPTCNIPSGEALPQKANVKALPDDRVWFPGEWEEVKAIVVTPYYTYCPTPTWDPATSMADPMVTGVAEYYQYTLTRGWAPGTSMAPTAPPWTPLQPSAACSST